MNEQKTVTVSSTAIRYGLIVGLVCVIYSLILSLTDNSMNRALSSVTYLFIIVGMVMAFKYYKQHNDGFMSYGQGLGIGSLLSLIAGFLTSVFMYIYAKFIDTEMMNRAMEMQRVEMEKKGMDDAQIDQAMEMAAKFSGPEMILIGGTFGFLFAGFIIALIVSAIMKHKRPEFE
jgi:chromate transport protein ChrA